MKQLNLEELLNCFTTGNFEDRTSLSLNPLNTELNPICHFLALLARHIFHVSRLRVNGTYTQCTTNYVLEHGSMVAAPHRKPASTRNLELIFTLQFSLF